MDILENILKSAKRVDEYNRYYLVPVNISTDDVLTLKASTNKVDVTLDVERQTEGGIVVKFTYTYRRDGSLLLSSRQLLGKLPSGKINVLTVVHFVDHVLETAKSNDKALTDYEPLSMVTTALSKLLFNIFTEFNSEYTLPLDNSELV